VDVVLPARRVSRVVDVALLGWRVMDEVEQKATEALARLIDDLEAENKQLRGEVSHWGTLNEALEAENERLRAERDKALEDGFEAEREVERLRQWKAIAESVGGDDVNAANEVERLRALLDSQGAEVKRLRVENERLRAAYDAKCAEFETAKEPVFAEGMRQGCEDLMMEAAKMADENERLRAENALLTKQVDALILADKSRLTKFLEGGE
jgi:regulator of replication initiation timing